MDMGPNDALVLATAVAALGAVLGAAVGVGATIWAERRRRRDQIEDRFAAQRETVYVEAVRALRAVEDVIAEIERLRAMAAAAKVQADVDRLLAELATAQASGTAALAQLDDVADRLLLHASDDVYLAFARARQRATTGPEWFRTGVNEFAVAARHHLAGSRDGVGR